MPEPIQFEEEHLQSLMKEIIDEILEEPSYGDETKAVFLKECVKSEKWADFVTNLSESISAIVFEKQTKVLPINQYEEMMRKMNTYLNSNTDRLKEALLCCGSGSSALAGRLVFRIATKLFEGAQKWALKIILNQQADTPLIECQEMSEPEETSFLVEISGFVRSFFSKGLKNPLEHRRSECIKAVFVDGQHPISKTQFLNKCNWYCGEEHNIVLSAHASSFFKIIESEIMPATIDTSSYQEVIENILLHRPLLDHWYYLSCAYFAEDLALLFLRDLVTSYVKFSLHFEERRLNRLEEKSVRASTVALRTHLVKNFVEKDDGSEDVS